MKWIGKYAKISIMAILVLTFLIACTSHPNEEQIQALEETKTAAPKDERSKEELQGLVLAEAKKIAYGEVSGTKTLSQLTRAYCDKC